MMDIGRARETPATGGRSRPLLVSRLALLTDALSARPRAPPAGRDATSVLSISTRTTGRGPERRLFMNDRNTAAGDPAPKEKTPKFRLISKFFEFPLYPPRDGEDGVFLSAAEIAAAIYDMEADAVPLHKRKRVGRQLGRYRRSTGLPFILFRGATKIYYVRRVEQAQGPADRSED